MAETITIMKLNEAFGRYAVDVLAGKGFIRSDPERKRGAPRRYLIEKPLPAKDEYLKLQAERYTQSLGALVDEARSEIESLRDELQGWYDNLPEAFQQGDKGSQLEDAVSNLENIDIDELPSALAEMSMVYLPTLGIESRRDRASEASSKLRAVAEELREFGGKLEEQQKNEDDEEEGEEGEKTAKLEGDPYEVNEVADALENAADELDGIEFPGMY